MPRSEHLLFRIVDYSGLPVVYSSIHANVNILSLVQNLFT